ncbi:MAG: M28 family peptidase [Woeseiaceae bacterium]
MKLRALAVTAIALIFSACSSEPQVGLEEALGAISQDSFDATTHFLADDKLKGRATASPEYILAANFVADRFAEIGLQPGGDDGWFQQVPFITAAIDAEKSGVILHSAAGDHELEWIKDTVVFPDTVRAELEVRAEVVFVGFGIHAPKLGYSDYEGIDVEGKIVATFWGGPESFPQAELAYYTSADTNASELARRGAIGQILIWDRQEQEDYDWDDYYGGYPSGPSLSWINDAGEASDHFPERLGFADISPASAKKLFADSPIAFEDALDAAEEFRPISTALGVEVTLYQKVDHERFVSPNVVAVLPGSDPELTDEYVVFSSHLDHIGTKEGDDEDLIYNGFYDNAVGIAVMLESAKALSKLSHAPRRSIIFLAVTGEEDGLFGSDYFAQNPTVPKGSIVANVNVDMPVIIYPMSTMTVYGIESSTLGPPTTEEVELEGFEIRPDAFPEENYIGRSDQYSFATQGIPFVYLAEGVESTDPDIDGMALATAYEEDHYHQVSDDLSQPLHWESMERFIRVTARVTRRIANEGEAPTWVEGDFFGDTFGP